MGQVNIINSAAQSDYKSLVYNFNVLNGVSVISLKAVQINVYRSFISGDNEETVELDGYQSTSVNHTGYGNPIGLPVNFIPARIKINSGIQQQLGTGATIVGISLKNNLNGLLSLPVTIPVVENSTDFGFTIEINDLRTGSTDSFFTLDIVVENVDASIVISKTIKINIYNTV